MKGLDDAAASLSRVLAAIEKGEINATDTERQELERALIALEAVALRTERT